MRRLFAIGLLTIFSLQFAGIPIYFSLRLNGIRPEAQQDQLPMTGSRDLTANGAEHQITANDAEGDLMSFFHSAFKTSNKGRKRAPSGAVKLLSLKYLTSGLIIGFSEARARIAHTCYLLQYDSLTRPLDTPPPRA